MKTAKIIPTSTLVVAALGLALGLAAAPALADKKDGAGCHTLHDPCGDPEGVTYTAKLFGTMPGAFEFGTAMPVPVTSGPKGASLVFPINPTVTPRGGSNVVGAWRKVFSECDVVPNPSGMQIPGAFTEDSSIDKGGGIRAVFSGIPLLDENLELFVTVTVQLIGTCFGDDGCTDDFLPVPDDELNPKTKEVEVTLFQLTGHTVAQGKKGHCNKFGIEDNTLDTNSTLEITALNSDLPLRPPPAP